MRICFISQWFDPEPSPIAGLGLVRWLRDQGHEIHVVTGFPNYPSGKVYRGYTMKSSTTEVIEDGITMTRVALIPSHDSSAIKRIATYMSFALTSSLMGLPRNVDFDVIYAYQGTATIGIPAAVAKRRYNAPYVLHVQDFWPDTVTNSGFLPEKVTRLIDPPLRSLCRRVYRGAERTIGLSSAMSDMLVAHDASPDGADFVINWAEESIFRPQTWSPSPESPDNTCTLLYAGNLGPFQRLDIAVAAAARVKQSAPNFELKIVGTGAVEDDIKAQIAELDATNVTMAGLTPYAEMGRLNQEADALLVSLDDLDFFRGTIPSKIQVAMASGRPVVGAIAGDPKALLERSGSALTCEPGDVDALAECFEALASMSHADRNLLGRAGRTYYDSELSLATGAALIERSLVRAAESFNAESYTGERSAQREPGSQA